MKYYVTKFRVDEGAPDYLKTVTFLPDSRLKSLLRALKNEVAKLSPGEELVIGCGEGDEDYFPPA